MISRRRVVAAALLAPCAGPALAQQESALARVRRQNRLVVAVYQDLPPFNVAGQGIDNDIAAELAAAVGVPLSLMPFSAGENIADDLRAAVWRGHFLGWGPADVMLHVPMERPLIEANPQVDVIAPYYRERVMLAWDSERGPVPESAASLRGQPLAAARSSLAAQLLAGSEGGALRDTLDTQFADGVEAARALAAGKVAGAGGLASELESALFPGQDRSRYAIVPLPSSRTPRNGWVLGCAVKRGADDLAKLLQDRLVEMSGNGRLREVFGRHGVVWRG